MISRHSFFFFPPEQTKLVYFLKDRSVQQTLMLRRSMYRRHAEGIVLIHHFGIYLVRLLLPHKSQRLSTRKPSKNLTRKIFQIVGAQQQQQQLFPQQGLPYRRYADTYIPNEDTHPVIRAIGVSHTQLAYVDELRRNLRSHSWSVFFIFIKNISALQANNNTARTRGDCPRTPPLLCTGACTSHRINSSNSSSIISGPGGTACIYCCMKFGMALARRLVMTCIRRVHQHVYD